jgi:hypothetical protein
LLAFVSFAIAFAIAKFVIIFFLKKKFFKWKKKFEWKIFLSEKNFERKKI